MFTLIAHWRLAVSLICGIEIRIRKGVQQKIGPRETIDKRFVVVIHGMAIEYLSCVESVIACTLQPYWEKVIIETSFNKLGIAT